MTNWKKFKLGDITFWKSGGTPAKMNKYIGMEIYLGSAQKV